MHRPYLLHFTRYNIVVPLRRQPKKVICTMFYFRFLCNPRDLDTENVSSDDDDEVALRATSDSSEVPLRGTAGPGNGEDAKTK